MDNIIKTHEVLSQRSMIKETGKNKKHLKQTHPIK